MPEVVLCPCKKYIKEDVFLTVKKAVDLLGGIEKYVKPGMRVLLKPNLLSCRIPEDAVNTHPEVVRAVARLVKSSGGIVSLGDAPGGYGKNIDEIFEVSGMKRVSEEEDIRLVRFNNAKFVEGIPFAKEALESDLIISLPKLKTHCITVITGAIKNTFGTVTGLYKAECHSRSPKAEDMAKILVKIHSLIRPALTIVDGITGMEGDGPSGGTPRYIGVIMAGEDTVAIDSCIAGIAGLKPLDVCVTRTAYEAGLGEADMGKIKILGGRLEDFRVKDFKLPKTINALRMIPAWFLRTVMYFIKFRPVIDLTICRRCNLCKDTCPVNAIIIAKDRCDIDYGKCVRCLCCHEVCPYKAIEIRRNFLARLVWG